MLGLRRKCSHCGRRRRVNAYWPGTDKKLCRPCSRAPSVAFAYSIRRFDIGISVQLDKAPA